MLADGELHDWWYDTDPPSREVVAPVFMKTAESSARGMEFDYTDPTPLSANGEKPCKSSAYRKYIAGMPKQ